MEVNSPKLWDKLLAEAPKGSVLMGGAVVDWFLNYGVPPKDYDIFHKYQVGLPTVPDNWEMTDVNFNDPIWAEAHQQEYLQGLDEEGKPPAIGSVYEYLVDDTYVVQLIGVTCEKPVHHFKNFDHSLTLGYYTKQGIFMHKKVFESYRKDTIEYVGKNKSAEAKARSLIRAQAKANKYGGDWTFKGF